MITIDRSASASIHEQLREQLRFRIASGRYKVNRSLPSTRKLADQLDISFHTVRKVYQDLESEGILEARPGTGFIVKERVPLGKSERMERGAAVVERTLQHLIGLGLSEAEVEYLFQEQLSLLESTGLGHKLIAVLPYRELADLCAEQIQRTLQQPVIGSTPENLSKHQDADFVFTPFTQVKHVMAQLPRADVIGIVTHLEPTALERISRLLENQTLGVVTKYTDAIQPLTSEIRSATSFGGQMIAASVDESSEHLAQFVNQTDLIVYTPPCRRRLLGFLRDENPRVAIRHVVANDSLSAIRQTVPA